MSSRLFIFFFKEKKNNKSIKGGKDSVIKYLGHKGFQLSRPFNPSSSMAQMRMFQLFIPLHKLLAGNFKVKSK